MLKNRNHSLKLLFFVLLSLLLQTAGNAAAIQEKPSLSGAEVGGLAVTVLLIVLIVLLFFFLVFKWIGILMTHNARKSDRLRNAQAAGKKAETISGEVNAAIVMALYLYGNEMHDQEDPVITMTRVSRTYSPWSSKIYGLRKSPR